MKRSAVSRLGMAQLRCAPVNGDAAVLGWRAGDEAGVVRGQMERRPGDLLGLGEPLQRIMVLDIGQHLWR